MEIETEQKKQELRKKAFRWFLVYLASVLVVFIGFLLEEPSMSLLDTILISFMSSVTSIFMLMFMGLAGSISVAEIIILLAALVSLVAVIKVLVYFVHSFVLSRQSLSKPMSGSRTFVLSVLLVPFAIFLPILFFIIFLIK